MVWDGTSNFFEEVDALRIQGEGPSALGKSTHAAGQQQRSRIEVHQLCERYAMILCIQGLFSKHVEGYLQC